MYQYRGWHGLSNDCKELERSKIKTEYGMKSWDNEDSISVFVSLVRKVFVPVVTEKNHWCTFLGTPCILYTYIILIFHIHMYHIYLLVNVVIRNNLWHLATPWHLHDSVYNKNKLDCPLFTCSYFCCPPRTLFNIDNLVILGNL